MTIRTKSSRRAMHKSNSVMENAPIAHPFLMVGSLSAPILFRLPLHRRRWVLRRFLAGRSGETSYQTYRDARTSMITAKAATKPNSAHKVWVRLRTLLPLCIIMSAGLLSRAIHNSGIQTRAHDRQKIIDLNQKRKLKPASCSDRVLSPPPHFLGVARWRIIFGGQEWHASQGADASSNEP
jgi:hypothetical protein